MSELGPKMGVPEMEESSEDENAPRTSGGVRDPSGSVVGLRQMNPRTSTTRVMDPSRSVVGLHKTTITDSIAVITAHEQTQRTIDDWMTTKCITFNMMKSEYWDKMVHPLMNEPKGFRYAKFENARTKRVEVTKGRVRKRVEELRQEWPTTGCMLQLDGWTDHRQRPHINVMVSFPKGFIFWRNVEKVMQTSKNLLKLLKKVDGTGPTISKVYACMDSAVEKLRVSKHFAEAEKDELKAIIMRRWNAMASPLHCAALFLDPEYRASRPEMDAEVADGFWTWLYLWCKESSFVEVDAEVCCWIEGTGGHNCEDARTQARLMQSARWWRKWCSDMPILQKQVARLLGQASSSSCCERNWSLFERIHSRLRNNLGGVDAIKLSTLVFNRWNQRLLDALIKKPKADKGSP
ncbi:hypothetical protein CBR_g39199 [Chara braunii]|uniref:Uncharacterized protein n=1 Tax=Chara braunii TaxID=69332 RepID=A0A388LRH8_CHABU|nr:hypothetical protein CBR_g39199 [Chara braunii]|eukprot:GBG84823.1 hypothetical protein CBR_g39199 [Chara braunii]